MARAARDSLRAFTEVESANIVITLDGFEERPEGDYDPSKGTFAVRATWAQFRVVANNIGRSSALITHVAHAWQSSAQLDDGSIMVGPPKSYIVKASDSVAVTLDSLVTVEQLKERPFLWLLVSYKAPLCDDEQVLRVCFEVFGARSNIPYRETRSEYWKKAALRASALPWWKRILGGRKAKSG
jgi:hypothetical protein